jgi:hypothetical protein
MSPLELRLLWYLDGRKMALWSEPSRRRLRRETQAISQILLPHIPRSCTHVRGHGGVKGALRQIQRRMPKARFVARFDIAAYYTSMRHDVIEAQVKEPGLGTHHRKLIADYLALPDMRDTGVGMLASFMSERATGTAFGNTCCVGTSAASTEWFAGEEASNAPGNMSVRISQGSIRPDECTVRGRLCEPA